MDIHRIWWIANKYFKMNPLKLWWIGHVIDEIRRQRRYGKG